jgi:hypothetical protein
MLAVLGAQGDSAEHQAALQIAADAMAQQAVPLYTHSFAVRVFSLAHARFSAYFNLHPFPV